MEKGKQEVLVTGNEDPITELWTKYKEYKTFLNQWRAKQSILKDAGVGTVATAFEWAVISRCLPGGHFVGGYVGVYDAINTGVSCIMERSRGKKDIMTSMAAGFGSGAMFSLVKPQLMPMARYVIPLSMLTNVGVYKLEEWDWIRASTRTYVQEKEKFAQKNIDCIKREEEVKKSDLKAEE